jgi:hypothetical protein
MMENVGFQYVVPNGTLYSLEPSILPICYPQGDNEF